MARGEELASGYVSVRVEDSTLAADLKKAERAFSRSMSRIERERATATATLDIKSAELDAARLKKRLRELDRTVADPKVKVRDKKKAEKDILSIKKKIDAIDESTIVLKADVSEYKAANAVLANFEKEDIAREKASADRRKAATDDIKRTDKSRNSLLKQRVKEEGEAEKQAYEMQSAMDKERLDNYKKLSASRNALLRQRIKEEIDAEKAAYAIQAGMDKQRADSKKNALKVISDAEKEAYKDDEARAKARAKSMRDAESDAYSMNDSMDKGARKAAEAVAREVVEVDKLQRAYQAAQIRAEKLYKTKQRTWTEPDRQRVSIDYSAAAQEAEQFRAQLQARNVKPIDLPMRADIRGVRLGEMTDEIRRDRGVVAAGSYLGMQIAKNANEAIERTFNPVRMFKAGTAKMASWGDKLGSLTVRLGPFTTSLRAAIVGLSLLGPALIGVIGASSALIGVLGAGVAGAAIAGGAALTGFGLAAFGVGALIKPLIGDLGKAMKAAEAYDKAVDENGENSKQAAKKMEKLENVLGSTNKETIAAFRSVRQMKRDWRETTNSIRPEFFNRVGQSINKAQQVMPQFGSRAKESFGIANTAARSWINSLGNQFKGGGVFDNIWSNFNRGLPSMLSGIASLGNVVGDVLESASRWLPRMMIAFSGWAASLDDAVEPGKKLNGQVDSLVAKGRDVGRFFMASGRLIRAFFGGGADEGQNLLNTLTDLQNRWAKNIGPGGKDRAELKEFFKQSTADAKALFAALAPVVEGFVEWSRALSPLATEFFKGAAAVGKVVLELSKMTALQGPLSALATTLGVLWAINKLSAFAAGLRTVYTLLGKVLGRQAASRALEGAPGLVGPAGGGRPPARPGVPIAPVPVPRMGPAAKAASLGFAAAFAAALLTLNWSDSKAALEGNFTKMVQSIAINANPILSPFKMLFDKIDDLGDKTISKWLGIKQDFNFNPLDLQGDLNNITQGWTAFNDIIGTTTRRSADAAGGLVRLSAATFAGTRFLTTQISQQQAAAAALQRYNAAVYGLADAWSSSRTSAFAVRDAQVQVNTLEAQGLKGTTEYKQAVQGLRDARRQQAMADQEWIILQSQMRTANTQEVASAAARVAAARSSIQAGNQSAAAQRNLANAARVYSAALNRQAAADLQVARARRGMIALTNDAEQSVGRLARRTGGAKLAKTISLKYEAPNDVSKVASAANKALSRGVRGKLVTQAILDSDSAEEAADRLNAKVKRLDKLKAKAEVKMTGSNKVIEDIDAINKKTAGLKNPKLQMKEAPQNQGIFTALATKLRGIKDKTATVKVAPTNSFTILSSIQSRLLGLRDRTVRVNTIYSSTNAGASGTINPSNERVVMASRLAEAKGAERTTGGVYRNPTLLVGEERRTEYVIATNPAYRDRNRGFLGMAANDLGMSLVESASGGKVSKTPKSKKKKATPPKPTLRTDPPGTGGTKLKDADNPDLPQNRYPTMAQLMQGVISESWIGEQVANAREALSGRQEYIGGINTELQRETNERANLNKSIASLEKELKTKRAGGKGAKLSKNSLKQKKERHSTLLGERELSLNRTSRLNSKKALGLQGGARLELAEPVELEEGKWFDPDLLTKTQLEKWRDTTRDGSKTLIGSNAIVASSAQKATTEQTKMNRYALRYSKTGDAADLAAWQAAQKARGVHLSGHAEALRATRKIVANFAKFSKIDNMKLIDDLDAGIADDESGFDENAWTDAPLSPAQQAALNAPPAETPGQRTAEDFLTARGVIGERDQLLHNLVSAESDDVSSNPNTLVNNKTAAQALKDFYFRELGQSGAEPVPVQTELFSSSNQYREQVASLAETIAGGGTSSEPAPSQTDLGQTARYSLMKDFGGNMGAVIASVGGTSPSGGGVGSNMNANKRLVARAPAGTGGGSFSMPGTTGNVFNSFAATSAGGAALANLRVGSGLTGATGQIAGGAGAGTTVTVNNSFLTQPADPLSWSSGVAFELGSMI